MEVGANRDAHFQFVKSWDETGPKDPRTSISGQADQHSRVGRRHWTKCACASSVLTRRVPSPANRPPVLSPKRE